MTIKRNIVFGNMNKVPFYKGDADVEQFGVTHENFDNYGTSKQTYIIDGSGVYITRNSESYKYGSVWTYFLFLLFPLLFFFFLTDCSIVPRSKSASYCSYYC